MAVYKQTYAPYEGPTCGYRWRFAILTRYSFLSVFESRLLATFFVICFIPIFLACAILYASHNAQALTGMNLWVGDLVQGLHIKGVFNLLFRTQAFLAFLLV